MKKAFIFAIALLVTAWGVSAQEVPPQAPAPQNPQDAQDAKYTNETIGRLSFVEGKAFVQRASDLGFEEGALNMPITEGDRIATSEGRAEVHFGRGNYLRLDADTKLDVLNLPKKEDDIARVRVWSGNVYLVVGTLHKEKQIELHTADASFYVLERGVFRINVRENSDTEIQVYQGLIEAAGEQGSTLLKGSQRLEITEGRFASKPSTFIAVADDSFDRFNESRTSITGREFAQSRLPEELSDYEGELDEYGEWTYLAPYGNVWIPYDVDDDWRPYYNGRWTWLPLSGWTWWPYEPWGWATFHYGRWHWGMDLGWYWIPMNIWGPAWVNWWWNDYYFGWAPLSYWGYPGVYMGGMYYGHYYGQYYPFASRALTVVRRENLKDPHIAANALRGDSLKSLNRITMTNSTLDVRPAGTRISVQPLDGSRVLLRNDGATRLERGVRATDRAAGGGPGGARVARRPDGQAGAQGASSGTAAKPRTVRSPDRGAKSAGKAKTSSSSGRNIRKKDGEPATSAMSAGYRSDPNIAGTTARVGQTARTVYGYPSSPSIRGPLSYGDSGSGRARTFSGPFSRPSYGGSIARPSTGRSSGPTVRSGSSRGRTASAGRSSVGSARGSSSRGSASRGSASRGS
ncbi:MAG: FecR domain-containing protein, partial [Candidatus Aminicenantes bacterium]|nr:FecR domain-containing protein [Candidatus Aminicenantes bacterium]